MNAIMHSLFCGTLIMLAAVGQAHAQVVPTTPTKFNMRPIGDASASAGIASAPKPKETLYRQVTYITLSPARQWKSNDGKSLLGKLIAFEDIVVETKSTVPDRNAAPAMPAKITVVRDGKVRLMVESKAYEVALDRLGDDERKFVTQIQTAVAAKK